MCECDRVVESGGCARVCVKASVCECVWVRVCMCVLWRGEAECVAVCGRRSGECGRGLESECCARVCERVSVCG